MVKQDQQLGLPEGVTFTGLSRRTDDPKKRI